MKNVQPAANPIHVKLYDGKMMLSIHTCNLNIPGLPAAATAGHIIPDISEYSLVSLVQLCKAGCNLIITTDAMIIHYNGKEIMSGMKCRKTGLWLLLLHRKAMLHGVSNTTKGQQPEQVLVNVYNTGFWAEFIQFLHQASFLPTSH